ncbi:hypothetical protein MNBD_CHLOROFLEXI01-5010 [hydrothermal vent metagenome]|uniref:Uncharacterized protein n=1 Tax=hydrothermal vent metagenome TaxID=652676 RepID=A0A3B0UMF8_9ZZZZ
MSKLVLLLVEDDKDTAVDFKKDAEEIIDVTVQIVSPPVDLMDLSTMVREYDIDAVILDEKLQQQSSASYQGTDAFQQLRNIFPDLPMQIHTEFPHDPSIRRHNLLAIRKKEFDEPTYKKEVLEDLYQEMTLYNEARRQHERINESASDIVTEEFVKRLADQHAWLEKSMEKIIWFMSDDNQEIRLIEVSRTALPTDTVDVFNFSKSEDIPFRLHIADVTPKDWQKVEQGKIALPNNWDLKTAQVFNYAH